MRKTKGVTLIALVVTIIVLLILATVSIATLTGENGILTQANKASYQTKLAELKENLQLDIIDVMNEKDGQDLNKEELRKILVKYFGEENVPKINDLKWDNFPEGFELTTEDGKYTVDIAEIYDMNLGKMTAGTETTKPEGKEWKDTVTPVADGEGNIIPVPDGFSYKEGTKETGFVIQDEEENEFVWVPCGEEDEVKYAEIYDAGCGNKWREKYSDKQSQYTDYNDWTDNYGDKESVNRYGGFYIGRYEAGLPEEYWKNGNIYKWDGDYIAGQKLGERVSNINAYKPVSKKNNPSWNGITPASAIVASQNMYNSNSVTSQLIDSYAWDTTIEWLVNNNTIDPLHSSSYGNFLSSTIKTNGIYAKHACEWIIGLDSVIISAKWRSYSTKYNIGNLSIIPREASGVVDLFEIATGESESTKTKNIYDLAGNMWEWTTEMGDHQSIKTNLNKPEVKGSFVVFRGGCFANGGDEHPICRRGGGNVADTVDISTGFRVVLYIK